MIDNRRCPCVLEQVRNDVEHVASDSKIRAKPLDENVVLHIWITAFDVHKNGINMHFLVHSALRRPRLQYIARTASVISSNVICLQLSNDSGSFPFLRHGLLTAILWIFAKCPTRKQRVTNHTTNADRPGHAIPSNRVWMPRPWLFARANVCSVFDTSLSVKSALSLSSSDRNSASRISRGLRTYYKQALLTSFGG